MKRARIVELINKFDDDLNIDPTRCQFKISFEDDDSSFEDIMSYNDILDYIEQEHNNKDGYLWKFRKIISHSLISGKRRAKDKIEVQIVWETGAVSTECLETLYKDIPVNLAIYTKENDLLEEEGWKKIRWLANRSRLTERLVKQAKLRSFWISPQYKYGFEVPKNYKHAEKLDKKNGNT